MNSTSDQPLIKALHSLVDKAISAYEAHPDLILEHARQEEEILSGGYGHRQLFELIQNGADAIQEAQTRGCIEMVLTHDTLYCANEGSAMTESGLRALLMAHMSDKRGNEIGRFGLGFKSVLAVSDAPEIFGETGDVAFNPRHLRERLRDTARDDRVLPRLRIACHAERGGALDRDPHLRALLSWATTVVRLPLKPQSAALITADLRAFPSEFLVFTPHVSSLILNDKIASISRRISSVSRDGCVEIAENEKMVRWRTAKANIKTQLLSEAARRDMDARLRERAELPMVWAIPEDGQRRERDKFWAFFPTQTETTLTGILNAPWKTNSDRENLLDGPFNRELLSFAAAVVAKSVPALVRRQDPGGFLDLLPARDSRGWADAHLSQQVYTQLADIPCMTTTRGSLALPANVRLRPAACFSKKTSAWFDEFGDFEAANLAHRSVETAQRRARAERLGCSSISVVDWLSGILPLGLPQHTAVVWPEPDTPKDKSKAPMQSIAAICLAGAVIAGDDKASAQQASLVRMVLTTGNRVVRPEAGKLFFAGPPSSAANEGCWIVHPQVAGHAVAREVLEACFNISVASPLKQLEALLPSLHGNARAAQWALFWALQRSIPLADVKTLIDRRPHLVLRVQTLARTFREITEALLQGSVIGDDVADEVRPYVVDKVFHVEDIDRLRSFGARECPEPRPSKGMLFHKYLGNCRQEFRSACKVRTPQMDMLAFREEVSCAPLDPLQALDGEAAVRMTQALLAHLPSCATWTMYHKGERDEYVDRKFPSLLAWVIQQYGWVQTSCGPRRVADSVSPSLNRWSEFLPIADCGNQEAQLLQLPATTESLTTRLWHEAVERATRFAGDPEVLGSFYAKATHGCVPPHTIRCLLGDEWLARPPKEVAVVFSPAYFELLRKQRRPALLVQSEEEQRLLSKKWGLAAITPPIIVFEPDGEATLVGQEYPGIADIMGVPPGIFLQPCLVLAVETRDPVRGLDRHDIDMIYRDSTIYFRTPLAGDARSLLSRIARELGHRISDFQLSDLFARAERASRSARLQSIKEASSLTEKLVLAVGAERLKAGIPQRLLALVSESDQTHANEVARLALAFHGPMVLRAYADDLSHQGLHPPSQWTGGERAVEFARQLGFPDYFAGFTESSRSPWDDVPGPLELPPLHDYQERISSEMVAFLERPVPGRGMLSLPTGAGKTRVVVESAIRWLVRRALRVRLLWIAQSDELCEQAVACWADGWRAFGPQKQILRINRLWGETNDRIREPASGSCVVVATFQSLNTRLHRPDTTWVFDTDLIVIDEAHGAIAPSYTSILERMGLTRKETTRPLIGLTATPFRGGDDAEDTHRLIARFEHTRFDHGLGSQEDLYRLLQDQGILSYADHEAVPGEMIQLTVEEHELLQTYGVLPPSAEARLGQIASRNRRIIEHIARLPKDWPILLFASSTDHAEDMAVQLNLLGLPSQFITASTPKGLRRHAVQAFKKGELRVLTNYGVLTTGFDAPSIRALYVTRPVYSPLLYQQMIGRGLRGPRNGGKPRCLIVNVSDNVANYGEKLAFHHFEHLWQRPCSAR